MADTDSAAKSVLGALAGMMFGGVFGVFGFLLVMQPASRTLGWTLFLLVPIAAGIAIVFTTRGKGSVVAVALLSTLCVLSFLVATGKEGLLCALMAFPFVFVALMIGVGVGFMLLSLVRSAKSSNSMMLLLLPVLIVGGHQVELRTAGQPRASIVSTSIYLPVPPEQVWPQIRSVDSIAGPKPLLMHVGLPVPQRCVLAGTAVGSKRTCYFDKGYIEESVLEWQPPYHMRLSIDRTNLPGRHWLGFENAEYTLQPTGGSTLLTRTTTITSGLSPSWYWGPLERWGVSSEHNYLFQDVARRVAGR
jgi:polyketide cyclase/dehydrase/lipid transport protein